MITVFVKQGYANVWDPYLNDWAGDTAREFEIVTYDQLRRMNQIASGALIFCDIERMDLAEKTLVAEVVKVVRLQRPDVSILNDPAVALGRYELLSELFDRSMNPFRVYRLTETVRPDRFPVFLRYEDDHTGALTGLLHDQRQLDRAIVRAMIRRHDLRRLIIVEYVDTSNDDGEFTKFGLFRVGDTFLARHAHRNTDWVVKSAGSFESSDDVEREMTYLQESPHDEQVRAVFKVGLIDYGRIDYATNNGGVVTWEINTNPVIVAPKLAQSPSTMIRQRFFIPRINDAFLVLSRRVSDTTPIDISGVTANIRMDEGSRPDHRPSPVVGFARKHKRWFEPAMAVVEALSVPFERFILSRWVGRNSIRS